MVLVEPVFATNRRDLFLQQRRGGPGDDTGDHSGAQNHQRGPPPQMQKREYGEHDRDRHQRRARHDHKSHVGQKAQGNYTKQQRQSRFFWRAAASRPEKPAPPRIARTPGSDRYSSSRRCRARRQLRLEREIGIKATGQDITSNSDAGREKGDENPHAALRSLEMIKQQRQQQELGGRSDRIKSHAPARVRPQCADQCQREQRDRHCCRSDASAMR